MAASFITHVTGRGRFYFVLELTGGEILLTSEPYNFRIACLKAIHSARTASLLLKNYDKGMATNGQHFFVLRDADGEILARSEFFADLSEMEEMLAKVRKDAPKAELKETSDPR